MHPTTDTPQLHALILTVASASTEADATPATAALADALQGADLPWNLHSDDATRTAAARVRRHRTGERRSYDVLDGLLRDAHAALDAATEQAKALAPIGRVNLRALVDAEDTALDGDLAALVDQAAALRARMEARVGRLAAAVGELEELARDADWAA